jgi:hypothetical protein
MSLKETMENCTSTEQYHNIMGVKCTDGVVIFATEGKANWAITDICVMLKMHKKLKGQEFISVRILCSDNKATTRYEDGDYNILLEQKYGYTDLEAGEYLFYYENDVLCYYRER